ncbi:MAG: FKBP-type peptidyl-prolyl cis-trans isomerase [Planctomycetota bacterium]|jgi:FKBP-type peptidyl-prolyl cis-trans isomerase
MRTAFLTILALLLAFGVGMGCKSPEEKKTEDPATEAPAEPKEPPPTEAAPKDTPPADPEGVDDQKAFLEANHGKEGVVTTPSGLQYKVLREGNGPSPTKDDRVTVHYRGTFIDGSQFDASYGGEPAAFKVTGVIKGWTEALQLMKVGSRFRLFIPSDIAYGERGAGDVIPPGATLLFEVELLEIWEKDEHVDFVYDTVDDARRALRRGAVDEARSLYAKALTRAAEQGFEKEKRHRYLLIGSHYNLACLCSLLSTGPQGPEAMDFSEAEKSAFRAEALSNLKRSLELGWKDLEHIGKDKDLDPIRDLPEFKALLAEWEGRLAKEESEGEKGGGGEGGK